MLGASRIGFSYYKFPLTISWTTTASGLIPGQPGGWQTTNGGTVIRFDVQDSQNCGGNNSNVQFGTATATINTGTNNFLFTPVLTGIGELIAAGYEDMDLILNGGVYANTLLITGTSTGGGSGCQMGPITQTIVTPPPHQLAAGTIYTFTLNFTTDDAQYHVGSYYECTLNFTQV
jgi:hypothetical protein